MTQQPTTTPTRLVGIDYGMKRIGIALSDERKVIASPLVTVTTERKSERTIAKVVQTLEDAVEQRHCTIEAIVVGMPLHLSGKAGLLSDEVTHFVELLTRAIPYPIVTWDERLTTVQAERALREANMSRKKRAKVIDTVAAVIILQNYLDSLQHQNLLEIPPT